MPQSRKINPSLIRSLEVLVAVAETGQMRAGARLLGITQPAASQHISALEDAYGLPLLDRTTRPSRLTHAGLRLHQQATRILHALSDVETEMRQLGPRPIRLLRIGLQASIATTLTPTLVSAAQDKFAVRDMTLHAGQSGDHERLLRTKKADLAITSDPFYDLEGLERHPVLKENFLLVVPNSYAGPTHSLEAIQSNLPLIRFADTTHAGRMTMQHLRRLSFVPDRVVQVDRSSMVTACVSRGMGFSLLTPTLLIDGLVEHMPLRLLPLPVAGMSRTLTVVARHRELQELPREIAHLSKEMLTNKIKNLMGELGWRSIHDI